MICEHGEQPESVADKVINCIKRLESTGSAFVSTRSTLSDPLRYAWTSDVVPEARPWPRCQIFVALALSAVFTIFWHQSQTREINNSHKIIICT